MDPAFQRFEPWEFEPGPDLPWLAEKAPFAKWGIEVTRSLWLGRWRVLLPLMRRKGLTEIVFFGPDHIDVETSDGRFRTALHFDRSRPMPEGWRSEWHQPGPEDLAAGLNIIQREIAGREVWTPGRETLDVMVEAQVEDGSRLEAMLNPCCTGANGASIVANIRRFAPVKFTRADYLRFGSFTEQAADIMEMGILSKATTLIGAATGTGKTTLFEYLLSVIPQHEFILTIEDTPELQVHHPRHRGLTTRMRPQSMDPNTPFQEIWPADLLRASLRLYPDWIVVGEIRDSGSTKSVADAFVNACASGHAGGATLHADSAYVAMVRLESMLRAANPTMKDESLRLRIADTIRQLIILERVSVPAFRKDGTAYDRTLRRVLEIVEVLGSDGHDYHLHTIFNTHYQEVAIETDAGRKTAMWPHLRMVGLPFFGIEREAKGLPMPDWWMEAKFELLEQIPRIGRVASQEKLLHI